MMEELLIRKNVNKNGGDYLNGKPLDLERRKDIIERYQNGEKVTAIAATLKVTHGVVSKIIKHYKKTGSYLPRKRSNPIERKAAKEKAVKFSVDKILEGTASESKKTRNLFAPEQIKVLERYFAMNAYLDAKSKNEIMEETKLSEKEITTWFTNKRSRLRKHFHDISSSSSAASESSLSSTSANSSNLSNDSILSSSSSSTSLQHSLPPPANVIPTIPVPSISDIQPIVGIPNPYIQPQLSQIPQSPQHLLQQLPQQQLPPQQLPPQQLPQQLPQLPSSPLHPLQSFQALQQFQLLSNFLQQASFLTFLQQTLQNRNVS